MVGSGALALWAVWATDKLNEYAPASYVAAAFGAALLVAVVNALLAYAKLRLQVVRFREVVRGTSNINPLEDTFRKQRIRVADLSPPIGGVIKNKTFIDCEIIGPANGLFLPDCVFRGCQGDGVDGLIVREGNFARNGFGFEGCVFNNCRFYLITFMVPENLYPVFQNYGWQGLNWLTGVPNHPSLAPPANQPAEAAGAPDGRPAEDEIRRAPGSDG